MAHAPLVSIVTPSYNQALYLEKTIRSVLNQDYENLEYLIVDGGSTDGSIEIIRKYEHRLSWWVSEKDSGQADGINKGLKQAKGEIVAWINSDDLYFPGAVSVMVDAFNQTPDMGFIYGDVLSIDGQGKVFNLMTFVPYHLEDLMSFNIISQPGVFIKRDILEKTDYLDMSLNFLFDIQLWLKLSQYASFRYVPGITAAARYHPMAKNVQAGRGFGMEAYMIIDWMRAQPVLAQKMEGIIRRVWSGAHRINARYLLDGGMPALAFKAYIKSLVAYPPIAINEWHRMLYSLLCLLGLNRVKNAFYSFREKPHRNEYNIYETKMADFLASE